MGYTGYKAIQYIDENPLSPTYMETTIEYVFDSDNCPSGDGEWVLVSSECEAVTSGYTGRRINIYYNDATNEYSSVTVSDSSCNASSNEELWVDSGNTYCEVDEDGLYTGRGAKIQVQRNSNLLNYGDTREVTFYDASCLMHLDPIWQDLSKNCHIEATVSGQLYYDGTADILQIDINPSSELYNTTRTINVPDEDCISIVCDSIEDEWIFVNDYCGNQVPANYNLFNLTADTIYHIYRKYEKCIVGGEVVRETPTNVFSAVTYQTGVSDCMYRWVDTEETVCQEFLGLKFKATYSGGTTYSAECDSNATLTSGETRPNGYAFSSMTEAEIGDCVTILGSSTFEGCSSLSSVKIPSGVTYIGGYAFNGCRSLSAITIPDSVTSICAYAFQECTSLTSIVIPDSVTNIDWGVFNYCSSLTSCTIGSGVTRIGFQAFCYCTGLTSIVIPDSVTTIGEEAFAWCRSLTGITVNAVTPPSLGSAAFYSTNNCPIYVPSGSVTAYKSASGWSDYSSRITAIS